MLLLEVIIITSNYSKNCKSLYEGMAILTHYPEQPGCELDRASGWLYTHPLVYPGQRYAHNN